MNTPDFIRVGLYGRVSSDHQAKDNTVASQIESLRMRIEQDGQLCQEDLCFIDDGYSGSSLIRPALERLRDVAAAGGLDRLYVTSPDRLARRYAYQVLLVDELQRCGVELVFLNHALGETAEDALMLQVQGVVAEYERAKIMERCRRGKLHAARKGRVSVMSRAPYGYRYVRRADGGGEAGYIIHMEEAQVVRRMFEWFAMEQISLGEVAGRLQAEGIASPRGRRRWERNTVWHILKNPTYRGAAAFGKTRCVERRPRLRPLRDKPDPPRRPYSMCRNDPDKWITIAVPAIVSDELFEAVAERLEENKRRHRGSRRTPYLLRGLTVCKCCGYAMCGITVSPGSARRRLSYYRCIGGEVRRHGGDRICQNKAVNAVLLEEAVWEDVRQLLAVPDRIKAEYERRLSRTSDESLVREREKQEAVIKSVERGIERLIDAYADGFLEKGEFQPKIEALRRRKQRLERQRASKADEAALRREMRLAIEQVEEFAKRVRSGLDEADWETQRALICALVKRIEVEKENVRIIYRVNTAPSVERRMPTIAQDCSRRSDPHFPRN